MCKSSSGTHTRTHTHTYTYTHAHTLLFAQVPQRQEYVYEQQWHGLPADEVEDLDDASINFDLTNNSDVEGQYITVGAKRV